MPAEGRHLQQGYLHRILVTGTKPFRYRSGIRTLLGLPSSLDARIAYPLPLPLAGFNYLRTAALNEAGVEAPRVFRESILSETRKPDAQARFQRAETAPRREAPPATRPFVQPSGATRPTPLAPADRKAQRHEAAASNAEELRIDIPGSSHRQVRFPALTPQPVDETPMPKAPQKDSGILPDKERTTPPVTGKMPGGTLPGRFVGVDGSVPLRPHPIRDAAVFKRANSETLLRPRPETPKAGRPAPVAEQPAKEAAPYRIVSSLQPSRVAEMDQSFKAPVMRHAADAQIAQIRRGTSILMRKEPRESVAQESHSAPQATPLERGRPVREVSQPIVIVNRPQPQRQSPPAFWERRYLSRMLRVRPLR